MDTGLTTNMYWMFGNCRNITSLDLTTFNVTNMQYMFYYCSNLESLNLENIDVSNVVSFANMFTGCQTNMAVYVSTEKMKN